MSDDAESGASVEPVDGSVAADQTPETGAQRIAQRSSTATAETDPTLRLLVEVWGELPDSVRNQILRLADESIRVRQ